MNGNSGTYGISGTRLNQLGVENLVLPCPFCGMCPTVKSTLVSLKILIYCDNKTCGIKPTADVIVKFDEEKLKLKIRDEDWLELLTKWNVRF